MVIKESAVFKDDKGWKVLTGFSDRSDYNYIDKKYHRFFDDDSLNEGYWAKENTEAKDFDLIFKRIAEIDKKKHIKNDKKEAIDDNRTIEQAVQKVLQKEKKQGRKKIMY